MLKLFQPFSFAFFKDNLKMWSDSLCFLILWIFGEDDLLDSAEEKVELIAHMGTYSVGS